MNLPRFIAGRYMLRQKGRFSAFIIRLAIVATTLSVAAMIVAIAMVAGFKYEIREKLHNYWGHLIVTPYSVNATSILSADPIVRDITIEESIRTVPDVTSVTPFVIRPALLKANSLAEGVQLKGVEQGYDFTTINAQTIDFQDSSYAKQIILSQTTMDRMEVEVGDAVFLYFMDDDVNYPRIRKVKVSSSYSTGLDDVDRHYAICDIRLLQAMQKDKTGINGYQLTLSDKHLADTIASELYYDILPRENNLYPMTMEDIFPGIYSWLGLMDTNGLVALIIMAFVAIIDLIAALLILIVEQARMVGVLKTLGMAEQNIRKVFLYHAVVIGAIGILFGNVLGVGLCIFQQQTGIIPLPEATYYMQYVPIRLIWWHPIAISIATLILCILCMWLPTLYIRRILPARVLQFK